MQNKFFKPFSKPLIGFMVLCALIVSIGCVTTQSDPGFTSQFAQKVEVSTVAPTIFYRWIHVDYTGQAVLDIQSGLLEFWYDETGDYLVQNKKKGRKTIMTWGNQLLLQEKDMRTEVFTAFILAVYALQHNEKPLDAAFEALQQILEENIYHERKEQLLEVIQLGIQAYELGEMPWKNYQSAHFEIKGNMIRIK
ncbi:MAG: hypothetical protein LBK43_08420 [Treponema sp.]|jgi:hypothetical protein|nr:hypothetical protein [Treponema sp.]